MSKKYEIFLFDLDGTITDSALGITNSVMYALKKFGIEETDRTKLYKFIGPPLTESFEKFYGFTKEQSLDGVKYYREYYHDKGIYENRVYDGLEEVLKKINEAGKQAIVATSKPEEYAKVIIDHFHLTKYFACVAGMEMDGGRGTKAQVITYALEKNDITDKSKVLMIGDREHDVIGAHENGLDCLGILYGFGSCKEFEEAGADYIRENVEDILQFV